MKTDLQLEEMTHKPRGAPDIELRKLQELGQQHYRAQEYQHALRCFTKAIELGPRVPIPLLDNRAATYIKLNNLDAALNDGRRMIQKEKLTCTGYLRTGQILQLYNNQKMALEIYEMGMRKVPNTSSQFTKLKEVHNRLKLHFVQVNPVDVLPLEIVEMIMKFLRFEDIVKLTRISKSWRRLLVAMPALWSDLDFVGARNPAKIGSVRTYILRANRNVFRVALDKYGPTSEGVARYVTQNCPVLQELRMNGGYLSSLVLKDRACSTSLKRLYASSQCRVSIYTISEIFSDCPNLEILEAHLVPPVLQRPLGPLWNGFLPHLDTLILRTVSDDHQDSIELANLLAAIPNVRELTIANWVMTHSSLLPWPSFASLHKLESLDISGVDMAFPLNLPSSLHTLNINKARFPAYEEGWEGSRLVRLSMAHNVHFRAQWMIEVLACNQGNLVYFDASAGLYHQSLYIWPVTEGWLAKVEELKFNNCLVDDELAIAIAENCPVLRRLSLANTKVSGVGVKALVTALEGKLEYLNLDGCKNTAYDAVEWARSKGVRVAFSFSEPRRGAKKLREG